MVFLPERPENSNRTDSLLDFIKTPFILLAFHENPKKTQSKSYLFSALMIDRKEWVFVTVTPSFMG